MESSIDLYKKKSKVFMRCFNLPTAWQIPTQKLENRQLKNVTKDYTSKGAASVP